MYLKIIDSFVDIAGKSKFFYNYKTPLDSCIPLHMTVDLDFISQIRLLSHLVELLAVAQAFG